ncbi:MAG: hypothetical protein ACJ739_11230 [Acidimicrobiales bacterium]
MKRFVGGAAALGLLVVTLAAGIMTSAPASASASVTLAGSFSIKATLTSGVYGICPTGVADECGAVELAGLGIADWTYFFGPTFEPDGHCFDVDGLFTLTLRSDRSTISGPLTGVFCPGPSQAGDQHSHGHGFGNPYVEDDTILFAGGTGQFEGLSGIASFHTSTAGAGFRGTLKGTLSG